MNSVSTAQLESNHLPARQVPGQLQCWTPQSWLGRSRWFEYYRATPRSRGLACSEPGAAEQTAPERSAPGAYLLRVVRQDLDEARRWEAIDRLSRRLIAAESFRHPQAVPVLDAEVDQPPFYVVEPFLPGLTLARWRDSEKESCTVSRSIWTLRQLAEIINAIHDHDRVHLGIAPEHLLVGPDGKITLTGWCGTHLAQQRTWLPQETIEDVLGRAPESAQAGYRAQTASDIYAWGIVAYWLLSGRWPLVADSVAALQAAHRQQIPIDLQVLQPNCPGPLNQLVNQAIAKHPLRRPAPKFLLDCLISIEIDHLHDQRRVA